MLGYKNAVKFYGTAAFEYVFGLAIRSNE